MLTQPVEQRGCKTPHAGDVAAAVLSLLLRSKQFDEDLGLAPCQLVDRVSRRGQIDEAKRIREIRCSVDGCLDHTERAPQRCRDRPGRVTSALSMCLQGTSESALGGFVSLECVVETDRFLAVTQRRCAQARIQRESVSVAQVRAVADSCLAAAVGPHKDGKAPRQLNGQLSRGRRPQSFYCNSPEIHSAHLPHRRCGCQPTQGARPVVHAPRYLGDRDPSSHPEDHSDPATSLRQPASPAAPEFGSRHERLLPLPGATRRSVRLRTT